MSLARALPIVLVVASAACTQAMPAPISTNISPVPASRSPVPASSQPAFPGADPSLSPPSAERGSAEPDGDAMLETVRALARLGPREATSPVYRDGVAIVRDRLEQLGYVVKRVRLNVPAGVSWGIPVRAGRTYNVIAEPAGFDPAAPHVIVGAHLDTVPQSPGANDNASGVAVMLELARMAVAEPPDVPAVFVAFGAEEPRGPGDDDHHYGSRAYVALLERSSPLAMMSLDRVGIGRTVRVCTGGLGPDRFARFMRARAAGARVEAVACRNRASDHWSFEKAGFPAARLLGADDPDYHTPGDRPHVVRRAQMRRVARLAWETLLTVTPADLRR